MRSISCKSAVSEDIKSKIARVTGGDPAHITPQDLYQGAAHSVRDELFDEFNTTNKYFEYVFFSSAASMCVGFLTGAAAAGGNRVVKHALFTRIHAAGAQFLRGPRTMVCLALVLYDIMPVFSFSSCGEAWLSPTGSCMHRPGVVVGVVADVRSINTNPFLRSWDCMSLRRS